MCSAAYIVIVIVLGSERRRKKEKGQMPIMYQKEMIYTQLLKNGERMGNVGFAKVENRDGTGKILLKIQNVPHSVSGTFPIRFYNGTEWEEIDKLAIKDGKGTWQTENQEIKDGVQLQIFLPDGYQIYGRSKSATQKDVVAGQQSAAQEKNVTMQGKRASGEIVAGRQETEPIVQQEAMAGQQGMMQAEAVAGQQGMMQAEAVAGQQRAVQQEAVIRQQELAPVPREAEMVRDSGITARQDPVRKPVELRQTKYGEVKEDKWEQILTTYPNIHPYGDQRVYVKLEPKDFIILRENYQHLVNNSFLLHGFYNYRYVILGKEEDYCLGVPGVYYEREKMVALMFGFEAFECENGIAKEGDFGYYLRKVEL